MTADLSRQTREAQTRLDEWLDTTQMGRYHLPYANPSELKADISALAARVDALQEALREVRKDVIAAHYAGWDSERKKLAETAVDRIDAVLASAVPAEGENA